jgi:3-hydroxyisobutyrate dehydrogenase-like beta-hydroxyacid dehydrogenase
MGGAMAGTLRRARFDVTPWNRTRSAAEAAAKLVGADGAAPFVLYKRAAFEHPEETPVAFSLDLMAKDPDLILGLAGEAGARMDQAAVNRATARATIAAGLGARDMSSIATFLRARAAAA